MATTGSLENAEKILANYIKVGCGALAVLLAAGIFKYGSDLNWGQFVGLVAAAVLLLLWVFFPLNDLGIMREWMRTRRVHLPIGAEEAYMIFVAAAVLALFILGAHKGALWYAAGGMGVFTCNLLAFFYIRHRLRVVIADAREDYREKPDRERALYEQALGVLEGYLCRAIAFSGIVRCHGLASRPATWSSVSLRQAGCPQTDCMDGGSVRMR